MNILLWVIQIGLALHTVAGAVWKFSNSEQAVPSLKALPHGFWMAMSGIEILCTLGLILPAFLPVGMLAPVAAACIGAEMLLFCGLHVRSGNKQYGPVYYWLVVAATSAFVAYGRLVLQPHS